MNNNIETIKSLLTNADTQSSQKNDADEYDRLLKRFRNLSKELDSAKPFEENIDKGKDQQVINSRQTYLNLMLKKAKEYQAMFKEDVEKTRQKLTYLQEHASKIRIYGDDAVTIHRVFFDILTKFGVKHLDPVKANAVESLTLSDIVSDINQHYGGHIDMGDHYNKISMSSAYPRKLFLLNIVTSEDIFLERISSDMSVTITDHSKIIDNHYTPLYTISYDSTSKKVTHRDGIDMVKGDDSTILTLYMKNNNPFHYVEPEDNKIRKHGPNTRSNFHKMLKRQPSMSERDHIHVQIKKRIEFDHPMHPGEGIRFEVPQYSGNKDQWFDPRVETNIDHALKYYAPVKNTAISAGMHGGGAREANSYLLVALIFALCGSKALRARYHINASDKPKAMLYDHCVSTIAYVLLLGLRLDDVAHMFAFDYALGAVLYSLTGREETLVIPYFTAFLLLF